MIFSLRLAVWFFLLVCCTLESVAQDAVKKQPVPDAESQTRAATEIKSVFKNEYAKKKAPDRHALATKLFEAAKSTKDDTVVRFVLFSEANDLASKSGDVSLAVQIVDEIAKVYEVRRSAMKAAALEVAAGVPVPLAGVANGGEVSLELVEEAIADDDLEAAGRFVKLAEAAARKSKNAYLLARSQARGKDLTALRKEFEKVKTAAAKLEKDPNDGMANAEYGKFVCLLIGDWNKGLPLLTMGSDAKLKKLAELEGRKPTEAADQLELGEGWIELANTQAEPYKSPMLMRSYHWFLLARPKLTALNKAKVENWMAQAPRRRLIEMEEFDVKPGPWGLGKGVLHSDIPIIVNEKRSLFSLSTHPNDSSAFVVKYRLSKAAKSFKGSVGLNDTCLPGGAGSPVTFKVYGDGKPLWASAPMKAGRELQPFLIGVAGIDVLELRAESSGYAAGAHAIWWEPQVNR
ncbi:NPCBM/NEW2 domain-containing protein [Fimbriiglobus ruber]|uniref:Glycosyl hydrolase family 98 putative carbohydrate-binding module domain-containing protein n=1 Tax=Fimbriiglobus ruber TaxID=1908690 RepID=A0A225D207_9BACT|nr:NPCBM/NEW2 domain-containing protein [Fimbriiglobus ruber]OWK35611.1 hypothetical protein FRUB_08174 [Fimbriiglobus ruber]